MEKRAQARKASNRVVFERQLIELQLENEYNDVTATYDTIYDLLSESNPDVTTQLNTMMKILSDKINIRKRQAALAKRDSVACAAELEKSQERVNVVQHDLEATREERNRLQQNIEEMRREHESELSDAVQRSLDHEIELRRTVQQEEKRSEQYLRELHGLEERNIALTRELEQARQKPPVIDFTGEEVELERKNQQIVLLKQELRRVRVALRNQQPSNIVVDTKDSTIALLRTQLKEGALQLQAMRAISAGKDDEIRALQRRVLQLEHREGERVITIRDDDNDMM